MQIQPNATNTDYLEKLLSAYWLRPETALWRAQDCEAMQGVELRPPTLDLGCGDGVFSFIRAGGSFEDSFDVFSSIHCVEEFKTGVDIYNYYDKETFDVAIRQSPSYRIEVGLDWKEPLLHKAKMLDLYEILVCHDANTPLPFCSGHFRTVFSNILYWLENPRQVLAELRRVTHPEGQIVLMLPDVRFKHWQVWDLYVRSKDSRLEWLRWLDRGNYDLVKHCHDLAGWEKIFREAHLRIQRHQKLLDPLTILIWSIGLRPISPALIQMVREIGPEPRRKIKREWVEILFPILCGASQYGRDNLSNEYAFHLFVLEHHAS